MRIRAADWRDALILYQWANDPICRVMALQQKSIVWGEHLHWFGQRLKTPLSKIYIGDFDGQISGDVVPFGQVRIDYDTESTVPCAWVDIFIEHSFRGQGLAKALLRTAINHYLKVLPNTSILAKVKVANFASFQLFSRSGFTLVDGVVANSELCYIFEY